MLRNTALILSILLIFSISTTHLSADIARIAAAQSARAAAEKDAKRDANAAVNKGNWMLVGMGTCVIGSVIGYGIISTQELSGNSLFGYCLPSEEVCTAVTIGAMTGLITALIAPASVPISPSPESLLGKPPVYIRDYTRAYKAETARIRRNHAVRGACLGGAISVLIFNAISRN